MAAGERIERFLPAIRLTFERRGLLPSPPRSDNRYREYGRADAERLRLLIGLRQLDIPLGQAARATMCAAGRCDEVSTGLRAFLAEKRQELARRMAEMQYLDRRMAHLAGDLERGGEPRQLIPTRKEDEHVTTL